MLLITSCYRSDSLPRLHNGFARRWAAECHARRLLTSHTGDTVQGTAQGRNFAWRASQNSAGGGRTSRNTGVYTAYGLWRHRRCIIWRRYESLIWNRTSVFIKLVVWQRLRYYLFCVFKKSPEVSVLVSIHLISTNIFLQAWILPYARSNSWNHNFFSKHSTEIGF